MLTPAYSPTATERVLPRMALDFTTASLDSRVTVTRALNTATAVNSSGYVATVNANLPRFDYDPTSLLCKGLLIEESRANLLLRSQEFDNIVWNSNPPQISVTANYGVGPDGLTSADRFVSAGGAFPQITQGVTLVAGQPYTASLWVKSDGTTQIAQAILLDGVTTAFTPTNTWTRITATVTSSSGGLQYFIIFTNSGSAAASSFLIWGAQIEQGAFATSYIPTTSISLTRNADAVSMTGTNFSSWYNATEGALLVQATAEISATDANVRFAAAIYDTAAYANAFRLERLSGNCRVIKTVSGSSLVASYSWPIDITGSAIMAYKDSNSASSFRAATPGLYAGGVPSGMAYLGIGGSHVGSNVWCGHVQRVMYWPQRVINAETQAFTK